VAHSDGERKQAQRRVDVLYAAAPLSIELSSLAGEVELSASAGVQDQLSVDLLTVSGIPTAGHWQTNASGPGGGSGHTHSV
jgi:hypothetical protein